MKDFQAGYLNGINEKHLEDVFSLFKNSIKENEISKLDFKFRIILSYRFITELILNLCLDENEKKLKNLLKKREQIKILIERQTKGEKLEINQVKVFFILLFEIYFI